MALEPVIGDVVLGMDSGNVDSVFIGGRPVKREGRLLDVDLVTLLRRAQQARAALLISAKTELATPSPASIRPE